jgi:hypothetical protein
MAKLAKTLVTKEKLTSITQTCNCADASLVGVTVGTRFNLGPGPILRVVGAGVELPSAGPILGAAGPSPRWNIDFTANTIRIDFLQQLATYGGGAYFTFSGLNPVLAGCPPAYIQSITVTTNKPINPLNVATATTFSAHTVTVPIAPPGINLDWQPGEYILIRLNFACETSPPISTDPCCPPWNKALLKSMMFYLGSGSIADPYTLRFQPTTLFKNQMQLYINYLNSLNAAFTSITIDWRLHNHGTGILPTIGGPQVGVTDYVTWNWNSTGNGTPIVPVIFTGFPMLVGTWYLIHTGIYLNNGLAFFPDKCANNEFFARIQVLAAKSSGGAAVAVLEVSDGKVVIDTVPINATQLLTK